MDQWLILSLNEQVGWGAWTDYLVWFSATFGVYLQALAVLTRWCFPGPNRTRERHRVLLAVAGAIFATGLACWVGDIYYRTRPSEEVEDVFNLLGNRPSPSFPSTHGAIAFTLAIIMGFRSPWQGLVHWLLSLIGTWARVYAGVHYPSDLLGSLIIAVVVGWILLSLRHDLAPALNRIMRALGGHVSKE